MREIGGYFGVEPLVRHPYYPELTAVNTARHALIYIVRAKGIRKLWLPYYLCESVRHACEAEDIETAMYHIDGAMQPVWTELPQGNAMRPDEYLYLVNYFGQTAPAQAAELKKSFPNLILDNVQAFFQRPVPGMDTVYSCRKFFGVPDGGYAATDAKTELPPERDISSGRLTHLLGRFESGSASAYYGAFKENDRAFMKQTLRSMSALTENLLGAIDYEAVRARREQNFSVLADALGASNQLNVRMPQGPYAYPYLCENGMEIKRRLAGGGIYVPTLWPNALAMDGTKEQYFAENILPLPCDQRYGEAEMREIIAALREMA